MTRREKMRSAIVSFNLGSDKQADVTALRVFTVLPYNERNTGGPG